MTTPTPTPTDAPLRLGDHVHHGPSDEDWVVLYVDGANLAPMGWPACEAKVADCEVIERCTDDEHAATIARLVSAKSIGSRAYKALRLAGVTNPQSTWTAPSESAPESPEPTPS